jgi:hypothetical protein
MQIVLQLHPREGGDPAPVGVHEAHRVTQVLSNDTFNFRPFDFACPVQIALQLHPREGGDPAPVNFHDADLLERQAAMRSIFGRSTLPA